MNIQSPRGVYAWPWFCLAAGGLAVVVYNSWALCCGRCTWNDLLHIPWWGILLLGVNLTAGGVLVFLRLKQRPPQVSRHCPGCLTAAGADWRFCPLCGRQRQPRSAFKQNRTLID